jgi:hypothetical protein
LIEAAQTGEQKMKLARRRSERLKVFIREERNCIGSSDN